VTLIERRDADIERIRARALLKAYQVGYFDPPDTRWATYTQRVRTLTLRELLRELRRKWVVSQFDVPPLE
jgi:LmbE family N-acetylglucosaminyl deacetylase